MDNSIGGLGDEVVEAQGKWIHSKYSAESS